MTNQRDIIEIQSNELVWQLRDRAHAYFPQLSGREPRVQLVDQRVRWNSVLCAFVVSTDAGDRRLQVKLPRRRLSDSAAENGAVKPRPRLFPLPDSDGKSELEYSTLSRIHDHFAKLNDPRFGAMRVLDYLPENRALVMEHVPHPSLSRVLMRCCRPAIRSSNTDGVVRNAGSWLRIYHQLPGLTHTRDRHETRADFLRSFTEFADYLAVACRNAPWVESVATGAASLADSVLPEFLPMGMSHGDYAPRNIFVGAGERVIVFDTLARWRAPIYEDIAHFLIALKLARPQVYSLGLAFGASFLARQEREFLRGYFGDETIPIPAIRLFEKLVLMDKWASLLHQYQGSTGIFRLARLGLLSVWSRPIRRLLEQPAPQELQAGVQAS